MSKKKALITGITGQDGAYLTRFLLTKDYQVFGLLSENSNYNNFSNFSKLSINEKSITKIFFSDLDNTLEDGFEIYNLAGQSSVGLSWEIPVETFDSNTTYYLKLLEKCRNKKVRILQASSAEMYGNKGAIALQEEMAMEPVSPYGLSKFCSHQLGKMYRNKKEYWITNAIFFNHESPLRDDRFVLKKVIKGVKQILNNEITTIELGNIIVTRDWGFAEDYVEVMWKLLQLDEPLDVNVATGKAQQLKDVINALFFHFGIKNPEKYITISKELYRPDEMPTMMADITRLKGLGIDLESLSIDNIKRLI